MSTPRHMKANGKDLFHPAGPRPAGPRPVGPIETPVLRYPGSKQKIADWVIAQMPPHQVYVEPFGGSAAVLMRKPRSRSEVYNDLDGDVVRVFRVLRDPVLRERLAEAVALTPYARAEYDLAFEPYAGDDPVEHVRRYLVASTMAVATKGVWQKSGFDTRMNEDRFTSRVNFWKNYPEQIAAFGWRLEGVVIEEGDGVELMERFDSADTLFYLDPPYLAETRTGRRRYRHDSTEALHARIAEACRGLVGMVALSGYPSRLYAERYEAEGWRRRDRDVVVDTGAKRVECLWLNPAAQTRIPMLFHENYLQNQEAT